MGDARGRFEGQTLVVETTNFHPKSTYRSAKAETLRLIERFTSVGPDKVEWSITVNDPSTWTKPWTFAMSLTKDTPSRSSSTACHEGNEGLKNILSAFRAQEKDASSK